MATTPAGMADGYIKFFIFVIYAVVSLPTIAIAIAAFVIGGINWVTECSNASFWSIQSWVITSNVILILFSIIGVILYCVFIRMDEVKYFEFLLPIKGLVNLPFNITGCIILFNYSSTCIGSLWGISLTTIILQWISMGLALCTIGYIVHEYFYNKNRLF